MAAWVAGGAAVVGDVLGLFGQSSTNKANAREAALNRQFQAEQTQGVENWEEHMSNTAMQRRVSDLTSAGLNPLLAVGQGGASQPSVSAPGGSQARFDNPAQGFTNLGAQTAQAIGTSQQSDLINAQTKLLEQQAKKTHSETPDSSETDADGNVSVNGMGNHKLGNATVEQIQALTGATQANAQQAKANVELIQSQVKNTDTQTALTNVKALIEGQNLEVIRATKQALIQQELAAGAGAANVGDVQRGRLGPILAILNAVLAPLHSAAQTGAIMRNQ